MKKNESLYQLIHSLSANEKRYFKIYASRHTIGEENNYVKLFGLFEGVKKFEDETLERLASQASFVKYFSAEKNYLYNLILDCLDSYHKESSVDRKISKLINIGRILMEKKLDDQGAQVLEKARKLSAYHNRYENFIPINQLLKKKAFAKETIDQRQLDAFNSEEEQLVNQIKSQLYYRNSFDQLVLHRRLFGSVTHPHEQASWKNKYPHLGEPLQPNFSSFDIEVNYLMSQLEYSRISRDREKGGITVRRLIQTMENERGKIAGEYIELYAYALYVFVVMRLYNSLDEANTALQKLRRLEEYVDAKVSKSEHARCFEFYFTAITDMSLESKNYNEVWQIIPQIEELFETYEPHMTPSFILVLHYNLTCMFFGLGEFRQALKWLNKVRNVTTVFREDIFYDLRTLNMIIHMELGNDEILPSLIKSAKYHNKKNNRGNGIQLVIMRNINLLLKANSKSQKQRIYLQLEEQLLHLKQDPKENALFNDVDLVAWANRRSSLV